MPKQTARQHKTAVRHAPAARPRRQRKVMHWHKPFPEMMPAPAIGMAGFKPTVIDVMEVDFLNDPDEVLADNVLVTGFEDEDL
jgi:hypothetical protein